jgi:sec-independent protein translocase protein TatA
MTAFILPLGVFGPQQLILIVIVVLILFGGKKIPELMGGLGKGIKEFKKATQEESETNNEPEQKKDEN